MREPILALHRRSFALALTVMCLVGAMDMTRGVSAPSMQQAWHLSYPMLGVLFSANSVGYLCASFLAGFLVDRQSMKFMLLSGGIITAGSVFAITAAIGFTTALCAFFALGVGTGWLEIAINGIVPRVSKSHAEDAKRFNTLHGFYGAGATTFPFVATTLNRQTHAWQATYILLGCLVVLILFWMALDAFASLKPRPPLSEQEVASELTEPIHPWKSVQLYGLIAAISVYVMAESGIASWLPEYLFHQRGFSIVTSSWFLTGFYFTFTLGRLTGQFWIARLGSFTAVLSSGTAALILLLCAVAMPHLSILFAFAGCGFAIIFPTIVAIASQQFPHHTGQILGILFTFSGIGSMVTNSFIGWLAGRYGLQTAIWSLPVMMSLVVVSMLFTLGWTWRQARRRF